MMKKILLTIILAFIGIHTATAQVGIGTESPKTSLQVVGEPASTTTADGVQVPSLSLAQLDAKITAYGTNQDGAIVYIDDVTNTSTTAQTDGIDAVGFFYYDAIGDTWKALGITTEQASAIEANTAKVGVKNGTTVGEMQYWDGSDWVSVAVGTTGQILTYIEGKPAWIDKDTNVDSVTGFMWKDITSSTGQIWMDRNLGASQVATSSTDANAYGDLYQWGRGADGHQLRDSGTTSTLSSTDQPGHGDFIYIGSRHPYDWLSKRNNNLWQGADGVNNPCPSGYRLPTLAELDAERDSWDSKGTAGAFASPLKLPMAGIRSSTDGKLDKVGTQANYWGSTVAGNPLDPVFLGFASDDDDYIRNIERAYGFSVRCIKD